MLATKDCEYKLIDIQTNSPYGTVSSPCCARLLLLLRDPRKTPSRPSFPREPTVEGRVGTRICSAFAFVRRGCTGVGSPHAKGCRQVCMGFARVHQLVELWVDTHPLTSCQLALDAQLIVRGHYWLSIFSHDYFFSSFNGCTNYSDAGYFHEWGCSITHSTSSRRTSLWIDLIGGSRRIRSLGA